MSMVEKFKIWMENRHEYARNWKRRTGGKVLGYFCTYMPEEILYAAGVLPVRVLGSHEPQDVTEPHIFGMFCPFCRDCLAQGLKGRFDYLDGIGIAQSCLHIRQAFTSWKLHIPTDYQYYLPTPNHLQSPAAKRYLTEEFEAFRNSLSRWIGKEITDDDLQHAIDVYNTNRRLMRKVYEFRKKEKPPITGLEAMFMVVSSQMVDKADHNGVLEEVLAELESRPVNRETGSRLMIIGSEDDDTKFVEMVESLGATIVVDDHCTGSRYFWNEVQTDGNPLEALANRYISRPPCPSKDWPERTRFPFIDSLVKDFKVDGAILIQQKFCDPHELDIPPLKEHFEKLKIPALFLEFDVTVPLGQFRIRLEAFLEILKGEDLF